MPKAQPLIMDFTIVQPPQSGKFFSASETVRRTVHEDPRVGQYINYKGAKILVGPILPRSVILTGEKVDKREVEKPKQKRKSSHCEHCGPMNQCACGDEDSMAPSII